MTADADPISNRIIGSSPPTRLAYALGQTARVGWYWAHYALTRRLAADRDDRTRARDPERRRRGKVARRALTHGMLDLLKRDMRNVEAGYYGLPDDLTPRPLSLLADSLAYFADLPAVTRRRREKGNSEVFHERRARGSGEDGGGGGDYPRYFLQNFHYQTGGYLSDQSARLYDFQVEVLFTGLADAMRRQGLVPIARWLARHAGRSRLLDVATGTGRFLEMSRAAWPSLELAGLDLSGAYLARARARLDDPAIALIEANAEAIPLDDASVDLLTNVYLMHELPAKVRGTVIAEMARVLRPGGRLVLVDSLQLGDTPDLDGVLRGFPESFHEPYYLDYLAADVPSLIAAAGLTPVSETPAWLSKVFVADKPA